MRYLKHFENSDEVDIKDKIANEIERYFYILGDENLDIRCIKRPNNHYQHNWGIPDVILVYIITGAGPQNNSDCLYLIDVVSEFIERIDDVSKKFNHEVVISPQGVVCTGAGDTTTTTYKSRESDNTNLHNSLSYRISTNRCINFSILIKPNI